MRSFYFAKINLEMHLRMYMRFRRCICVNTINSKFSGWYEDASPNGMNTLTRIIIFSLPPSLVSKLTKTSQKVQLSIQVSHPSFALHYTSFTAKFLTPDKHFFLNLDLVSFSKNHSIFVFWMIFLGKISCLSYIR